MSARTLLPQDLGPVHFIGIGGIGMSGIAEMLLGEGYAVQGSDAREGAITERLTGLGATIHLGHDAAHVGQAGVIVVSTAIKPTNPELVEAKSRGIPVIHRSQMLAELMRLRRTVSVAGTHGKTTTTTMVAAMLDAGGFEPGVINGGVIHAYGSNARAGKGEWMVVEADESDGSFNRLPTHIGIVTNIDPEHLEHWGSFEALRAGFDRFVADIPFYGLAVLCADHAETRALAARFKGQNLVTFGFDESADIRAENLRYEAGKAVFDVRIRSDNKSHTIENLILPMPGNHNVSNALSAIAIGRHLEMSDKKIRKALAEFSGVGRRFTRVGEVDGVAIIDDYGHHPVEIAAVLRAARQAQNGQGRVIAAHQPHRFTRLHALFDDFARCFEDADIVAIADVYSAGEDPIAGADRDGLISAIKANGHSDVHPLNNAQELAALVKANAQPGDMVVCLGAGTISAWAYELPELLGEVHA